MDPTFMAALVIDALFLATGCIQLGFCLVVQSQLGSKGNNGQDTVRNLLYEWLPLKLGIVNAVFVLFTFLFTIPGFSMPGRSVLKTSSWMVMFCGIFTLIVGVYVWILTLKVKLWFGPVFAAQDAPTQSLIQKTFNCCGYLNSTSPAFITDETCPSPAAAALTRGCSSFISTFGNTVLDEIFTALFGMVGVDFLLVMAMACVLKVRLERERYRIIDQKNGFKPI